MATPLEAAVSIDNSWAVIWPVAVPMITSAIAICFWGQWRRQVMLGITALVLHVVAGIALLHEALAQQITLMVAGSWPVPFGIALVADPLGALMVLGTGVVSLAILIYTLADGRDDVIADETLPDPTNARASIRSPVFVPLFLTLVCGVTGGFLTGDIFNLYVWFEIMLIATFGLMVLGGRAEQMDGAIKYAFLNLIATTLLLIAIGLIYGITGALNMADLATKVPVLLADPDGTEAAIALLFLMALGMKAAAVPAAFWLPAAYHTALPGIAALFGALLTKVGVYALIRLYALTFADLDAAEAARHVVMWIAAATMLAGSIGALAERDIRRVVSFLVMAGVGVMLSGLALGTEDARAMSGAIFYILHSMAASAALFMAAGLMVRLTGTSSINGLAGLYKAAPTLAVLFFLTGISMGGVPPFAGFWPKLLLVQAALGAGAGWLAAVILFSGFLTLFGIARLWSLTYWRPHAEDKPLLAPAGHTMALTPGQYRQALIPVGFLAVLGLFLGLAAGPMTALTGAAAGGLDRALYIEGVFGLAVSSAEVPVVDIAGAALPGTEVPAR